MTAWPVVCHVPCNAPCNAPMQCTVQLNRFAKLHADKKNISIGFIGYPNVGKSSVINTLKKKKARTMR